jgi:RNA polymerase sigma-70 factor (ECF subfamily)
MDPLVEPETKRLLAEARAGNRDSLGALLERCRPYLRMLACSRINAHLQTRANPSDLVQETFLQASRYFSQFHGHSEREWMHWLRRILSRRLHRLVDKHVRTRKRDVYREVSLEWMPVGRPQAHADGRAQLAAPGSSPSARAVRRELTELLAERLARLKPAYREVLVLRNLKSLSFEEVARRMGRSPGAIRVLWLRALCQLRQQRFEEYRR